MDATLRTKIETALEEAKEPKRGVLQAALGFLNLSEGKPVTYNSRESLGVFGDIFGMGR